jgi:type II secretory pathway pseudopilin PulG
MEPQTKTSAKDFFINLGAIIALGTIVGNVLSLLFTVIEKAYPPILSGYYYYSGTYSISFPVASLIIFFPIYILLMWLLERDYSVQPEKRHIGVRKWLTYITLFFAGLAIAGDLVTVIYYFIDGQEMTMGFIMKVLSVLVVALAIFFYYIYDSMGKLNTVSRKVWTGFAFVIILGSIIWGFSVLGSPRTQQLIKYDQQKVSDLQNLNNQIQSYFYSKNVLPNSLTDLTTTNNYYAVPIDQQTKNPYEYNKTNGTSYELCAEFNKDSKEANKNNIPVQDSYSYGAINSTTGTINSGQNIWTTHPAGHYCFAQTVASNGYPKPVPVSPLNQ